jgi:hypothetical protein
MWDLWWTKRHWVRFSPSTSVSPTTQSTDCSTLVTIHNYPGLVQQAKQWRTHQVDSLAPTKQTKEKKTINNVSCAVNAKIRIRLFTRISVSFIKRKTCSTFVGDWEHIFTSRTTSTGVLPACRPSYNQMKFKYSPISTAAIPAFSVYPSNAFTAAVRLKSD